MAGLIGPDPPQAPRRASLESGEAQSIGRDQGVSTDGVTWVTFADEAIRGAVLWRLIEGAVYPQSGVANSPHLEKFWPICGALLGGPLRICHRSGHYRKSADVAKDQMG